jgi:hypothetical protein
MNLKDRRMGGAAEAEQSAPCRAHPYAGCVRLQANIVPQAWGSAPRNPCSTPPCAPDAPMVGFAALYLGGPTHPTIPQNSHNIEPVAIRTGAGLHVQCNCDGLASPMSSTTAPSEIAVPRVASSSHLCTCCKCTRSSSSATLNSVIIAF